MLDEINAAIEGALAGGATEIVLNDSHGTMANLDPRRIAGGASYISGRHKPRYMMQGLDDSFDAAFLVGYHGSISGRPSTLSHTYNPEVFSAARINGELVGESGINALVAEHFGVPIAFVSGDSVTWEETRPFAAGRGRGDHQGVDHPVQRQQPAPGRVLPPDPGRRRAGRPAGRRRRHADAGADRPATLDLEFQTGDMAEVATWARGARAHGGAVGPHPGRRPARDVHLVRRRHLHHPSGGRPLSRGALRTDERNESSCRATTWPRTTAAGPSSSTAGPVAGSRSWRSTCAGPTPRASPGPTPAGAAVLAAGGSALDAVCATVEQLEDDPLFNAGRGAALTAAGTAELDACVMTGDGRAGAITACRYARNPVLAARKVMEETPPSCSSTPPRPGCWTGSSRPCRRSTSSRPARQQQLRNVQARALEASRHGTVGAVALDAGGRLAAATSTGGMVNQNEGRVGDTPIVGAGTYARDGVVAISCTGEGEAFIKGVVAHDVAARMRYLEQPLPDAVASTVEEELTRHGAMGGLIAVGADGSITVAHNSPGHVLRLPRWRPPRDPHVTATVGASPMTSLRDEIFDADGRAQPGREEGGPLAAGQLPGRRAGQRGRAREGRRHEHPDGAPAGVAAGHRRATRSSRRSCARRSPSS